MLDELAERRAVAARRRRGALHLRVGPRLPARVPAPRRAAEALGRPPMLALTATAAPPVRDEIVERLGLRDPSCSSRGFDRPNIRLAVERFHGRATRKLRGAARPPRPPRRNRGSSTSATRARAPRSSPTALRETRLSAAAYHAGMRRQRPRRVAAALHGRRRSTSSSPRPRSAWASTSRTSAWSSTPRSPSRSDSYYQEIGRAGRDGEPAEALLFYRPEDLGLRRFFAGGGNVDVDEIAHRAGGGRRARRPGRPGRRSATRPSLSQTQARDRARPAWRRSARSSVLPRRRGRAGRRRAGAEDAIEAAAEAEEQRREFDRSRVDMMRAYAETARLPARVPPLLLRRAVRRRRAGTATTATRARGSTRRRTTCRSRSARASRHGEWGEGVVQRYEDDKMVVLFDDVGYKTLSVELVVENDLLEPA